MKFFKTIKYEWRDINFKFVLIGIIFNFIFMVISLLYSGKINLITVLWLFITTLAGCSIGIIYNNTEKFREVYKYKSIFLYILMLIFNILWMPLLYRADNVILALVDAIIIGIFVFFVIYFYSKVNYIATIVMMLYFLWILFIICLNITYLVS